MKPVGGGARQGTTMNGKARALGGHRTLRTATAIVRMMHEPRARRK